MTTTATIISNLQAENEELRQQLAAANAEIERLKAQVQSQALDCLSADGQALDSWTQLAAAQLQIKQYREALENYKILCQDENHYSHYLDALKALAQPTDTTALEALIAKAGEAMRERATQAIWPEYYTFREAIRALPGVTLADLK